MSLYLYISYRLLIIVNLKVLNEILIARIKIIIFKLDYLYINMKKVY